jgi:leucyl-tRNA synthetase
MNIEDAIEKIALHDESRAKMMNEFLLAFKNNEEIPRPSASSQRESATSIEVITTRPDTLFGATYMVLAPEHELVQK